MQAKWSAKPLACWRRRTETGVTMNESGRLHWIQPVRETAVPLQGEPGDYDVLLDRIGDASYVLLGGSTLGSREFHHARGQITTRLIEEKNFSAVALEADWLSLVRANGYVRWMDRDTDGFEALGDFASFPAWVGRNYEMLDFIESLRRHNSGKSPEEMVYLCGLDLYGQDWAAESAIDDLDTCGPEVGEAARRHFTDLEQPGHSGDANLANVIPAELQTAVADRIAQRRRKFCRDVLAFPAVPQDDLFHLGQSARAVERMVEFYQSLLSDRIPAKNLRGHCMAASLEALSAHIGSHRLPKIVIWGHNLHVGNAMATAMADRGEINLGQLAKRRHGQDAVLVGFTTFGGTVTAAPRWTSQPQRKWIRPAKEESCEGLFHASGVPSFCLIPGRGDRSGDLLEACPQRAIGPVYLPHRENSVHYFEAVLPEQFDAVLHFDLTSALEPLDGAPNQTRGVAQVSGAAA